MTRIKSAYEIAMEKANQISDDNELDQEYLDKRETLKPILAKFYRNEIDAEELWQELKDEDEKLLADAQKMIVDSLGLRTTGDEFSKRKEGILALESLKETKSSGIEQMLSQIQQLQEQYSEQREKMEDRIQREMDKNSQMQMKPVKTKDGRTVMKLESGIDKEARERFNKALSQLEQQASSNFNSLVTDLKHRLE